MPRRSSGIKDSAGIVARGSQRVRQRLPDEETTGTEKACADEGEEVVA